MLDSGLADLNSAIGRRPDLAYAYYLLGVVYERKDDLKDATADFAKTIELSPDSPAGRSAKEHLPGLPKSR